jgi:glutathione synthase/RimK-type ligase-like ATP-grasp enzyme
MVKRDELYAVTLIDEIKAVQKGVFHMRTRIRGEIPSKWRKHKILTSNDYFTDYLPETEVFEKEAFFRLLNKHPFVMLKPLSGTGGKGIIKVTQREGIRKGFIIQERKNKYTVPSKESLMRFLGNHLSKHQYIIQQGIELISYRERPIDFRILLIRPQQKWEYIGIMGKCAARNKVVTNFCKGGTPLTFNKALSLSHSFSPEEIEEIEKRMQKLGYAISREFEKHNRHVREIGIDVALDVNKNIWILEVNTRPMFNLFRFHTDKYIFGKIKRQVIKARRLKGYNMRGIV